jgi:hypothetical protein
MAHSSSSTTETVPDFDGHNDEETWRILIDLTATGDDSDGNAARSGGDGRTGGRGGGGSGASTTSEPAEDIKPLLSTLAQRIQEDWCGLGEENNDESQCYWKKLKDQATKNGFHYSDDAVQSVKITSPGPGTTTGASTSSMTPTPAAFQTEAGKNHLEAVSAILGLSSERAKHVTLGTLRSIDAAIHHPQSSSSPDNDNTSPNLSSLLGSPDFLVQNVVWEYRQRMARMHVLLECLRLEQDPSIFQQDVIVQTLDALDSTFHNVDVNGKKISRGIFRALVTAVGRSKPQPRLKALEPSRRLLRTTIPFGVGRNEYSGSTAAWSDFCSHILIEQEAQFEREREVALKTLLVLLYDRIENGIQRSDYAMLLTAFGVQMDGVGCNWFMDDVTSPTLSNFSALITAECMALWRLFENDSSGWSANGDEDIVDSHPLLSGPTNQLGRDMQNLMILLSLQFQSFQLSTTGPVAVAGLSFGLFLCLAHDSSGKKDMGGHLIVQEWRNQGSKLVEEANDDAFTFLDELLDELNPFLLKSSAGTMVRRDSLYEYLTQQKDRGGMNGESDNGNDVMALENSPELESLAARQKLSADTITYTSITREVMAACIASFADPLLDVNQPNSIANIEILCKIVSKVYRNNRPLIEQFWAAWYVYEGISEDSTSKRSKYPICALLEVSYSLAVEGYVAYSNRRVQQELFLSSVAPFLQVVSSMCDGPERTAAIFDTLPDGLIRDIVLSCDSGSMPNHRVSCLQAMDALLRQNSITFVEHLRNSLESQDGRGMVLEGPKMLGRILRYQTDHGIITSVLSILSKLLHGASPIWILSLHREFSDTLVRSSLSVLTAFFTIEDFDLSSSAAVLLCAFVDNVATVIRNKSVADNGAAAFVQSLAGALLSSISFLASSRPSADLALCILNGCSNYLAAIRPILINHGFNNDVREACIHGRDILISALSTGTSIGEAVAYYAVLPVSLCVVAKMDEVLGQSVIEQELVTANSGVSNQTSLLSGGRNSATVKQVLDNLVTFNLSETVLDEALAKGLMKTTPASGSAVIEAASAAVELLSNWTSHLELCQSSATQAEMSVGKLGPENLLCSLAPAPELESTKAQQLWRELGVSTFELMTPYISQQQSSSSGSFSQLSISTLKLLCGAVSVSSTDGSTDSMLFVRMGCFDHLSSAVVKTAERGIELIEKKIVPNHTGPLSKEEEDEVLCAYLCLQLMSTAAGSGLSTALAIFRVGKNPGLVGLLERSALSANNCLQSFGPDDSNWESREKSAEMQIATLSVRTLSALWKTLRSSSVHTGAEGVELAKEFEGQNELISGLAEIVCGIGSIIQPFYDITSIDITIIQYLASASEIIFSELAVGDTEAGLEVDTLQKLAETSLSILRMDTSRPITDESTLSMMMSLSGLALFGIDLVDGSDMTTAEAIRLLSMVSVAIEVAPIRGGDETNETWQIHENLFSTALLLLGRLIKDKDAASNVLSDDVSTTCTTTFVAICQFLRMIGHRFVGRNFLPSSGSLSTMHLCFSILTELIVVLPSVTETMSENKTFKIAMSMALHLSRSVAGSQSQDSILRIEDAEKLLVIQSVFELAAAVADRNETELLGNLNCLEFSQLVVRNPLFALRARACSMADTGHMRGYEFKGNNTRITDGRTALSMGIEDPVFKVWIQSMHLLQAMVRTSSAGRGTADPDFSQDIVALSNEFLQIYRQPLFACLKSCCEGKQPSSTSGAIPHAPKLNTNLLREATALLALIAELCKRETRGLLSPQAKLICSDFVGTSKDVIASIGRFLGAGARARALFDSEMKASDVDSPSGRTSVPDASYQAIKYSSFSDSRREPIAAKDIEDTKIVPASWNNLGKKQAGEDSFVHRCRLLVANQFAAEVERNAAECLSAALSLVWRTHAVSMSLYEVRGDRGIDVMALVSVGAVISFKSPDSFMSCPESSGQEAEFGTILDVDTVSRQWQVGILGEEGQKEIVKADWIVGIEDLSMRKPSTVRLSCAPENADVFFDERQIKGGLSTGAYILILEWCYTQALLEVSLTTNTKPSRFQLAQQLAEQTMVLLAADLVLHEMNGDFALLPKNESKRLDKQVFELFADITSVEDNVENDEQSSMFPEGKLMKLVDPKLNQSIQAQVRPMVVRAWKEHVESQAALKKRRDSYTSAFHGHQFGWH